MTNLHQLHDCHFDTEFRWQDSVATENFNRFVTHIGVPGKMGFGEDLVSGDTLLDIGTGPSILSLVSASRRVKTMILAEYADQNTELLEKWWNGTLEYDASPNYKRVTAMEGNVNQWDRKEDDMRKKVLGIIPCDVMNANILAPCVFHPFDIVSSSMCLESAVPDVRQFRDSLRKMRSLIKNNGYLVLTGVCDRSLYTLDVIMFHILNITKVEVTSACHDASFDIIAWKEFADENPNRLRLVEIGTYYVLAAKAVIKLLC